jgi:hypothetical protein
LGRKIASYKRLPPSRRQVGWTIALVAFVVVIAAAAIGRRIGLPWLPLGSVGLLTALLIRERLIRRAQEVALFQRGLAWSVGHHRQIVYWIEVLELYRTRRRSGADRHVVWTCRLLRHGGRRWRLDGFEDLGILGARIESAIVRQQLPGIVQSFREGYPVRFGPQLAFSRHGVHIRSKSMAWHGVREIALEEGRGLRIVGAIDRTEVIHLTAAQVPNLGLLAVFLEAIRGQAGSSAQEAMPAEPAARADADLLAEPDRRAAFGNDPSDLLLAGFDWEDIHRVMQGEVTLEELLARGPRHRPRHPR